jgi:hypothetical protein
MEGKKKKKKTKGRERPVGGLLFNNPNVLTSLLLGISKTCSIR